MNDQKDLKKITDDEGNALSPILPKDIKNYLIDIDGTVTEDVPNEEPERMLTCEPYPDALEVLNTWYEEGHIITFFTSRTEEHREYTERWLKMHKFKYHGLLMNKPRGGNYHWIDNHLVKATRFRGKFTELIKVSKDIEVFNDDYVSE
ncbi:MAG: phosphoheptose isomerase [Bacteroidota bacterium]|nr:phosphoheptose isomerase [Bacteroidota bacterium]